MKRFFLVLSILGASHIFADQISSSKEALTKEESIIANYKEIDTESLKKLIDTNQKVVLLDARKKLKGGLLPGAKNLPFDAEESEVEKILGSIPKNTTIVVYCANLYCPLSKYLAERLSLKGFSNVYKYPDGIAGWLDKDYALDPL